MSKLKKQHGFTLIEMLIVVAIIAILIAVSIPMVGSALERARENTDAANERAFKAALLTSYLQTQAGTEAGDKFELDTPYCYDAVSGTFSKGTATGDPYGQGRGDVGVHKNYSELAKTADHQGCYLWGYVDSRGNIVYMEWISDTSMTGVGKINSSTLTGWWLQNGNTPAAP